MIQYLSEVMGRTSIGGLTALLVFLLICLLVATIRGKRQKPEQASKPAIPCPMCGQEVQS